MAYVSRLVEIACGRSRIEREDIQSLLLGQSLRLPHSGEVLVLVVAWTGFPTSHAGAVWDDSVPPQGGQYVRLLVKSASLELSHDAPLFTVVASAVHLVE